MIQQFYVCYQHDIDTFRYKKHLSIQITYFPYSLEGSKLNAFSSKNLQQCIFYYRIFYFIEQFLPFLGLHQKVQLICTRCYSWLLIICLNVVRKVFFLLGIWFSAENLKSMMCRQYHNLAYFEEKCSRFGWNILSESYINTKLRQTFWVSFTHIGSSFTNNANLFSCIYHVTTFAVIFCFHEFLYFQAQSGF